MKWWHALVGLLLLAVGYGVYRVVTVPAPGVRMEEQGRQHVTQQEVAAFKYNSNPPTSGPHLSTWVAPGIYDTPQSEGELIHSLEHGYVIISYNCNAINETDACKVLIEQLKELARRKKLFKLIVVPRSHLTTAIALTAWDHIDTFDEFDAKRIERFIDFHRDHGPEKTME